MPDKRGKGKRKRRKYRTDIAETLFVKDGGGTGFEKLWVWQKAHRLALDIHRMCMDLPAEEKYHTISQIRRSSSSVEANISEGYGSYYYKDKIKGFFIARKEAVETQDHLRSLCDKGYLAATVAGDLSAKYEEVIRGINGFVRYIRRKAAKPNSPSP